MLDEVNSKLIQIHNNKTNNRGISPHILKKGTYKECENFAMIFHD